MFPEKKYDIIYADPPWSYNDKGFGKRMFGSEKGAFAPESGNYNTMSLEDIKNLPVSSISSDNCALLMWVVGPLLPEALEVINAWGFKYKTIAFCWTKTTAYWHEVSNLGQWTNGNVELCLLGTKGHPKRIDRTIRQLVKGERTIHSKKPYEVMNRIERLFGDVPRIELFAREEAIGWEVWGDEIAPSKRARKPLDFAKIKA